MSVATLVCRYRWAENGASNPRQSPKCFSPGESFQTGRSFAQDPMAVLRHLLSQSLFPTHWNPGEANQGLSREYIPTGAPKYCGLSREAISFLIFGSAHVLDIAYQCIFDNRCTHTNAYIELHYLYTASRKHVRIHVVQCTCAYIYIYLLFSYAYSVSTCYTVRMQDMVLPQDQTVTTRDSSTGAVEGLPLRLLLELPMSTFQPLGYDFDGSS